MTRREEIEKAATEFYKGNEVSTFVVAAQWADRTMLDKVCDWLQCMGIDYMQGDITDVKWGSMFADLRNYIENGDD
jgi:hypothetical protein